MYSGDLVWEVVVDNIGSVYYGRSERKAREYYRDYLKQVKEQTSRAGDSVVLFHNGEIVEEYENPVKED